MSDDKTRILKADEVGHAAASRREDGSTRILSAEEMGKLQGAAARAPAPAATDAASRAPQFVGDKIVFFCANGHRIVVPRDVAGKRGVCSKAGCGVAVVIPMPPPDGAPAWPVVEQAAEAVEPEAPAAEGPVAEGPAAAEPAETDAAATAGGTAAEPEAPVGDAGWPLAADGEAVEAGPEMALESSVELPEPWGEDEADNPTARLMARLWIEVQHGGAVELHLANGSVIRPDAYESRWSRGTHGVFANSVGDDRVTLTAVAWDSVQKIVVLNVKGLPDGMFE